MAIPIKEAATPKVAKRESRVMKNTDPDYDILRRLTCDLYIACQNMTYAYDYFRRATMGDDYVKIASANSGASIWFSKAENKNYIDVRRLEIAKAGFDEYCKIKNIEHSEFTAIEDRKYELLAGRTPAEIRRDNQIVLQKIIDESQDDITVLSATKQLMDLNDAKFKDKSTELSDAQKLVHTYLPAPVCDNCPLRHQIENQFKDSPEVDLNLDDEEITN